MLMMSVLFAKSGVLQKKSEMSHGYNIEKYKVTLMALFEASRETFCYIVI